MQPQEGIRLGTAIAGGPVHALHPRARAYPLYVAGDHCGTSSHPDALTSATQDAEQEALAEETVVVTGVGSGPGMAAAAAMARSADLFGQRQDGLVVGSVHESVELLGC